MDQIDILVPVKDEGDNIEELVLRIERALGTNNIAYNIIFIDDSSTDDTVDVIGRLAARYPIKLQRKQGKPGKAYSILEGVRLAQSEMVAILDGDLQYPPEAIPEMYALAKYCGIAVARRRIYDTTLLRELGSRLNRFLFGRVLLGLKTDVQSGLKVVRREILDQVDPAAVTPWTLDGHILHIGSELGYRIGSVDIYFSQRRRGRSKVKFLATAWEIGLAAIKLRLKRPRIYELKPQNGDPFLGAGLAFKRRRFITHTNLTPDESAFHTLKSWQKLVVGTFVLLLIGGALTDLLLTAKLVIAFLSSVYFLDALFSLILMFKSLHQPPEVTFTPEALAALSDEQLPVYTILCPLYREARMVPHFLDALRHLDWPKEKLDVILLLEEDDRETLTAVQSLELPAYVRLFVVPHSFPKTKPKACNFGLVFAKGEQVVIYDAEDRPEPLQLRKAYLGFQKQGEKLFCLQSKLNFYNPQQNLLTKLFTAEYSLWFDIILQGIQSIEATIPLGGTSNHFRTRDLRELGGWDPFNVTEDCDLGVRIFKKGYKTAIIDSTTFEEANSMLGNWLRQRSRWIKGYLQTYFVHMRHPIQFLRRHGIHALLFQLVIGMRMTFMLVNPFLWLATVSYFALHGLVGATIEALYPTVVFYMAVLSLTFGNFMYLYSYMIGCARRRYWPLVKYVFLVPIYWLLASTAAYLALYQLARKPHYWEKTHHGLHLTPVAVPLQKHLSLAWVRVGVRSTLDRFVIPLQQTASTVGEVIGQGTSALTEIVAGIRSMTRRATYTLRVVIRRGVSSISVSLAIFNHRDRRRPSPERLRILLLNWRDTKHAWAGGAEVYVHELARHWVREGHEVTLLCGNDGSQPREERVDGVRVIRRGGFYTVYLWAAIIYLTQLRNKVDIVIDTENGVPFFTPLYVRQPSILVVFHVHQEIFRKHLPLPMALLATLIESTFMPLLYRNRSVVTISESSKRDLIELGFTRAENISVVHPGVDLTKFSPRPKTDYPSFVYLGRHKPYKNIDVAIRAFARLRARHPQARLTIAGEGESTQRLIALSRQLGLLDAVSFPGRVSEPEKARLLAQSWAALQPSSIEGWGLTVIEANAAGTPVVAANVKGLWDSIVHGVNGVLLEPPAPSSFAYAMEWLIADGEQRMALAQRALLWARQFRWEEQSGQFLTIVVKELGKGRLLVPAAEGVASTAQPDA